MQAPTLSLLPEGVVALSPDEAGEANGGAGPLVPIIVGGIVVAVVIGGAYVVGYAAGYLANSL